MSQFDKIEENYAHQFARQNPKMLTNMFGADDLESFWLADMDFKVADPITKEFQRLVDRGVYAYEFAAGDVFKSLVEWNKNRHGLDLDGKSFVQVSGVLTGIALLIRELTNPEDEILIQTPVYHQFARLIKTANRKIVRNPLKIVDGKYEMDFDDLEEKLSSGNVKMILLCNPHNPVGRVWTKEEMEKLVEIADKHEVNIVSDEIHSDIIYLNNKFNSIASIENGSSKHIAVLGSPAKTFGMQSISNGYLYIPDEDLRKQVKSTVESMYLSHGNAFTTFGTIAAFKHGEKWLDELLAYMEKTLAWIEGYTENEMPKVKMSPVEGTYQVWLDFREAKLSKEELYSAVANKAKLALTPGNWFDRDSELFMRMNIASPLPKVQGAFEKLNAALE